MNNFPAIYINGKHIPTDDVSGLPLDEDAIPLDEWMHLVLAYEDDGVGGYSYPEGVWMSIERDS